MKKGPRGVTAMLPSAAVIFSLTVRGAGPRKVTVTRPTQLTSYSRDKSGALHYPGQDLRPFALPETPCNLNEGLAGWSPPPERPSLRDPILEALDGVGIGACPELHFVTFRNNLNKIMETPYNKRDSWEIDVKRANGTVFLDVVKLPDSSWGQSEEDQRKFTYWGYNFESFCTKTAAGAQRKDVNPDVEWCAVMKVNIGDNRIAMAAEIDCFTPPGGASRGAAGPHDAPGPFVEIKTARLLETERHHQAFARNKLLRFWIQSFLAGVPKICVGFRDDLGVVRKTEMLDVLDIPRRCADVWSARVCIDFTNRVLDMLREKTVDGNSYTLRFQEPFQEVELCENEES